MRLHLLLTASLALASTALAGCDPDDFRSAAPARTAAAQCAPAPLPACPGAKGAAKGSASASSSSSSSSVAVTETRPGGVYRTHGNRTVRGGSSGERHYRHVEHYGYVDEGNLGDDAYASGATMRRSSQVTRTESSSSSSRYSESSSSSASGGGSSGYGYESSGGAWRSSGHQGRLVIRGHDGQGDSWTWRTAGHDEDGYLTWPGKSPR